VPDIGYYTLPVIPSFRGIESATQDALDKAFRDSGKKAGEAYADEHDKAFRDKTVEKSRNPDAATVEAHRRTGAASGKAQADAHNEAFNKTRADDPAAVDTATKTGTEQGKASGQAAGKAHNEELKKTTTAESESIGRVLGEALGKGAGNAAAGMIEDMLPKALRGLGLESLGASIGENLGGAIGEHAADVPDALIKGWDTVADALNGVKSTASDVRIVLGTGFGEGLRTVLSDIRTADVGGGLTGALSGIKSAAGGVKDGLGGALESLRNLSATDVTSGLDRVAGMVQTAEPLAKAFGVDVSSWPESIRGVISPVSELSDTFTTVKGAIADTATSLAGIAEGSPAVASALGGIATAAGPLAAVATAIGGIYLGIQQIRNAGGTNLDTSPAALGLPVGPYTPTATPDLPLPGRPQVLHPADLPPVARIPGQRYVATPGSLDPFAALGPAPPPASHPIVLPPSPFGIDLPGSRLGGEINGPGPKGQDSVLMFGAPGEHMWTADEVDRAGGHGAMYALRAMAKSGALSAIAGYDTGGPIQGQGGAAGGGNLANLYRYVDSMAGTPYSTGNRTDCSGMAARIASVAVGLPPTPAFTTMNEGSWLTSHGFIMGNGPAGTLRIGWYDHGGGQNGHTAVTLPDGTHAESGGSHGGFLVGSGAAGAENSEFENRAWLPMNPQGTATSALGATPGGGVGGAGAFAAGGAGGGGGVGMAGVAGTGGGGTSGGTGPGGAPGGGNSPFDKAGGFGAIGDIGKQFMSDTFGFGSILPGLDKFPPLQMLFGLLGGLTGGKGGTGAAGSNPASGLLGGLLGSGSGSAGALGSLFGMLPHMSRGGAGMAGVGGPDIGGASAGDSLAFPGISFADKGGAPTGPQRVDQSTNVTVNGFSTDDVISRVTRQLQWTPRLQTYTPPGAG
jgi:hypothetical protein